MHPDQRAVLMQVEALLDRIGSANDAQDHGSVEEAERMRAESCASIRRLLAEHPFLDRLLPTLRYEVESGHILGFGWSNLEDDVKAWLAVTGVRRRS